MKKRFVIIVLVLFFPSLSLANTESQLIKVAEMFRSGEYQKIYDRYLIEIPDFEGDPRIVEELFYYYAATCMYLGFYDEAEGYLYAANSLMGNLQVPEKFYYYLAKIEDKQGETEKAYQQYLTFLKHFPESGYIVDVLYRLGRLSLETGRFEKANDYFKTLTGQFPNSPEAIRILKSDDFQLDHYFLVFGRFQNYFMAKQLAEELEKVEVEPFIHRTNNGGLMVYLVGAGFFNEWGEAEDNRLELEEMNYQVEIYP